jgi:imidazolonepropionase-like amidohydrolase
MKYVNHVVAFALVCCGCWSGRGGTGTSMLVPGDVWIRDVTVVSAERDAPLLHAHVVIRAGRIASVGVETPGSARPGITVVDGAGKFLTPGLIDGHVHLAEVPGMSLADVASKPALVAAYFKQLPHSYLYFGFTTVVDLDVVDRARLEEIRKAELGPTVFDCGNALEIPNGYLMASLPPSERFERNPNFLYDPRQASSIPVNYPPEEHSPEAAVARVERAGGRCVKASYEPGYGDLAGKLPVPTLQMMQEVREASRRHHLPLLLHANSYEAHTFAVEAGVDAVVHGIFSGEGVENSTRDLSQKVLAVLDDERDSGMAYMPTSRVLSGLSDLYAPEFLDEPRLGHAIPADLVAWYRTDEGRWFANQLAASRFFKGRSPGQIRDMFGTVAQRGRATNYSAATGGRIVFGSDTPSAPTYANPPGYNGYLELRELEAIGLPPRQVLAAATTAAARLFNLDADYGTVAPGKTASLLLLRDDPMMSTAAWDSIETVIVRGRVVPRATLSAHSN